MRNNIALAIYDVGSSTSVILRCYGAFHGTKWVPGEFLDVCFLPDCKSRISFLPDSLSIGKHSRIAMYANATALIGFPFLSDVVSHIQLLLWKFYTRFGRAKRFNFE